MEMKELGNWRKVELEKGGIGERWNWRKVELEKGGIGERWNWGIEDS